MQGLLLDQTVEVKRLGAVPGGNKKAYSTLTPLLRCHIQPIDEKTSTDIAGGYGKNWLLMCDPADIIEGDRVIWRTKEYRVVGVDTLSFMGEDHTEAILRVFEP